MPATAEHHSSLSATKVGRFVPAHLRTDAATGHALLEYIRDKRVLYHWIHICQYTHAACNKGVNSILFSSDIPLTSAYLRLRPCVICFTSGIFSDKHHSTFHAWQTYYNMLRISVVPTTPNFFFVIYDPNTWLTFDVPNTTGPTNHHGRLDSARLELWTLQLSPNTIPINTASLHFSTFNQVEPKGLTARVQSPVWAESCCILPQQMAQSSLPYTLTYICTFPLYPPDLLKTC